MSPISTDDLHILFNNLGNNKLTSSPISSDDLLILFKHLDKSSTGRITISNLHNLLRGIGIQATSKELKKLVGGSDLDYVDFLFFYEAIAKDNGDDMWKAFKVFDVDGDGFISCEELEMALTKMGFVEKESLGDCRDMIRVYDKNFDGFLDFDEFKDMMSS